MLEEAAAFGSYQYLGLLISKVEAKRGAGIHKSLSRLGKPVLELNLKLDVWISFLFRCEYTSIAN